MFITNNYAKIKKVMFST